MRTTNIFLAGAAAVALLLSPNAGQAATRTQSETFDSGDFSFNLADASSASVGSIFGFNVDQFDPSLGTLDNVSVSYSFTFNTTVTTASTPGGCSFSGGGAFVWDANNFYGTGNGTGAGGGPFQSIPMTLGFSGTIVPDISNGLTVGMVQGTGVSFLSFQPGFSLSAPAGSSATGGLSSGSLSITYDYTPAAVPEPTTLGFAALASLLVLRFKSRS